MKIAVSLVLLAALSAPAYAVAPDSSDPTRTGRTPAAARQDDGLQRFAQTEAQKRAAQQAAQQRAAQQAAAQRAAQQAAAQRAQQAAAAQRAAQQAAAQRAAQQAAQQRGAQQAAQRAAQQANQQKIIQQQAAQRAAQQKAIQDRAAQQAAQRAAQQAAQQKAIQDRINQQKVIRQPPIQQNAGRPGVVVPGAGTNPAVQQAIQRQNQQNAIQQQQALERQRMQLRLQQQKNNQAAYQQLLMKQGIKQQVVQQRMQQQALQQRALQQQLLQQRINAARIANGPGRGRVGNNRPNFAHLNLVRLNNNRVSPIYRDQRRYWHRGGWRTLAPLAVLGAAMVGGTYLYADGYVPVGRRYCEGTTPEGCHLNWRMVEFEGGGEDWQCVQYCPRPGALPPPRVAALAAPPPPAPAGKCEISIFSEPNFGSQPVTTSDDQEQLSQSGWDDQIASIQVVAGVWEVFTDENYGGESTRLEPGQYATLTPEFDRKIGSFMCAEPTP